MQSGKKVQSQQRHTVRTPQSTAAPRPIPSSTLSSVGRQRPFSSGSNAGLSSASRNPSYSRSSSMSRPSNFLGRDPRQDRELYEKKVWDYLFEVDFKFNEMSVKDIAPEKLERTRKSPSKADFTAIFVFLVRCIDDNEYMTQKIEEDMPRLMQALGYPYQLKLSTMQTIGAPHVMGQLYQALAWLVDVIKIFDNIDPQELLLAGEDDDGTKRSLSYGYAISCFQKSQGNAYIDFDPNRFPEDSQKLRLLIESREDLTGAEKDLGDREAAAEEALLQLTSQPDELPQLKAEEKDVRTDYESHQRYYKELTHSLAALEKKKAELEAHCEEWARKVAVARAEVEAKQQQIAKQTISGEEAREIRMCIAEANETLSSLRRELSEAERTCDTAYKSHFNRGTQLRSRYDAFVREFEDVWRVFRFAQMHGAIPHRDAAVRMRTVSPNEAAFVDFLEDIQELLHEMEEVVRNRISDLEKATLDAKSKQLELAAALDGHKVRLEGFRRAQQDRRHKENMEREDWATEQGNLQIEVDLQENEVKMLRNANKELVSLEDLAEAKRKTQLERQTLVDRQMFYLKKASEKVLEAVRECDRTKERIKNLTNEQNKIRNAVAEFLRPDEPSHIDG